MVSGDVPITAGQSNGQNKRRHFHDIFYTTQNSRIDQHISKQVDSIFSEGEQAVHIEPDREAMLQANRPSQQKPCPHVDLFGPNSRRVTSPIAWELRNRHVNRVLRGEIRFSESPASPALSAQAMARRQRRDAELPSAPCSAFWQTLRKSEISTPKEWADKTDTIQTRFVPAGSRC